MSDKQDEMWAALEAHKPDASYAKAWVAAFLALMAADAAEEAALRVERYAQEAIDALREVKP